MKILLQNNYRSRLLFGAILMVILSAPFFVGCNPTHEHSSELNLDDNKTPYITSLSTSSQVLPVDDPRNQTTVMCDIDGDGIKEKVEGTYQKFIGMDSEDARTKPRWEVHLDEKYVLSRHTVVLGVCDDFNNDGIEEIYFTATTEDKSQWVFCVLDPAVPAVVLTVPLPLGEDRRRPDYWDGNYRAEGILQDADGHGNPGIVLVRRVGYDATKRGVCVVNPHNGEIIWEYISGAQVYGSRIVVTDMDGDGKQEILFGTSGPGNLGNTKLNGTGDSEIYLIALSNLGTVLIQEVIGGERFQGVVATFDLNGNGFQEIVTATSNGNNGRTNELAVWDWKTRSILKKVRTSKSYVGLAIIEGPTEDSAYIFAGSDDGTVLRYQYQAEALKCDRMVYQDSKIAWLSGAVDILPPPGQELVVSFEEGNKTVILDRDLNPLAIFTDQNKLRKYAPMAWNLSDNTKALVLSNPRRYWVLEFDERPLDVAEMLVRWGLPVLGILLLGGTYFTGVAIGRRRGQSGDEIDSMVHDRTSTADFDSLYRLFQELEDANHSVVGPAKGLERLVWLLEAFLTELGDTKELELRIGQILDDFLEEVGPRLFRILYLAEQVSFETGTVSDVGKALKSLTQRVENLDSAALNSAAVREIREDLRAEWGIVRDGFYLLRTAINTYYTTDPVRLIQGMLLVREGDFQRERIHAKLLVEPAATVVMSCRMDNGDLRFVMDNLLENAIRAMRDCSTRNLTVQFSRAGKEVTLRVIDTGKGIESSQTEAIFSSRFSTRSGGGRGLHRSQEILARWGAELQLADTTPGKGTTFMVKLLAADDGNVQKTMKSQS